MLSRVITAESLPLFAYTNAETVKQPVRGLVLDFHGLGNGGGFGGSALEAACREQGLLYVFPFYGPWAWMNRGAVHMIDEIVDVLFETYGWGEDFPIVTTGGSMGGQGALVYTRYARRTPVACAANCPVCDLLYHYGERPDVPRSIYQAFAQYDGDLEAAMHTASPLHLAAEMPDIPYYIVHGAADDQVSKLHHSDRFVKAMQPGHTVTYCEVPDMGHCALPAEAEKAYIAFILSAFAAPV